MNKSQKLISLFLSTALILGTAGCGTQARLSEEEKEQQGNDQQTGNNQPPVIVNTGGGFLSSFFGPFGPFGPFGFFSGRASGFQAGVSSGIGGSYTPSNPSPTAPPPSSNVGVKGVSPWGVKAGSSSASGSISSSGGVSSGAKGGIGSSGSSVS